MFCELNCEPLDWDDGNTKTDGPSKKLQVPALAPRTRPREQGIISYTADLRGTLIGPPLRVGEVWHVNPDDRDSLDIATLSLHCNGMAVRGESGREMTVAWSPFSLVQACRLHSVQADAALPWLRLFKVSVFQHGSTHFFAARSDEADAERARWVADIARAIRLLTQSLFPGFALRAEPLPGAEWTTTRLLAGYLLLCDDQGVSLVYCELHCHWDSAAVFAAYEDEYCDAQVVRLRINAHTCVSERVGIDCSCFSFDNYHFTTRTCAEKMLWLRAISNVKVKLRHHAPNPTPSELTFFRSSILEYVQGVEMPEENFTRTELLPRRGAPGYSNVNSARSTGHEKENNGATVQGVSAARAAPTSARSASATAESVLVPRSSKPRLQDLPSPHKLGLHIEMMDSDVTAPCWPDSADGRSANGAAGEAALGSVPGPSSAALDRACKTAAKEAGGDMGYEPAEEKADGRQSLGDPATGRTWSNAGPAPTSTMQPSALLAQATTADMPLLAHNGSKSCPEPVKLPESPAKTNLASVHEASNARKKLGEMSGGDDAAGPHEPKEDAEDGGGFAKEPTLLF